MNHGQKSHAVRLHNKGLAPAEIGKKLGIPRSVVHAFLSGRPGWPNRILSATKEGCKSILDEDGCRVAVERQKPSLPKLRFMGEIP